MDDTPNGLLLFGICFGVIGTFVLLLWGVNYLKGWRPAHMSTSDEARPAPRQSVKPVLDQSAPTRLHDQTSAAPAGGLEPPADRVAPDMDAEQTGLDGWEMPRVSRYLKDDEFIIFLASQKLPNGKYRLSANDIVKTVRGDRTEVLAIVRQVREPAPEFRPLTDEQQRLRHELQLER
jgi:hypothetical protein